MSAPETHKAAVVPEAFGRHEVRDVATPSPGSDEILVRITATAINPIDWKIRDWDYYPLPHPAILGSDASGIIVAIGSSITNLQPNDRVFFQGIIGNGFDSSTFRQYAKMPASLVAKTPDNISDDQAAGISLATVAVATGFYDSTGMSLPAPWTSEGKAVGDGKAVVVLGGSSSVGQYAVQLARLSGFTKIITNASTPHFSALERLGATKVLDRKSCSAADFVDAAGDTPISFVYDAISEAETQELGVRILQAAGVDSDVVTVLQTQASATELGQKGDVKVGVRRIVGVGSRKDLRHVSEPLMQALGGDDGWIAKGQFVPNNVEVVEGGLRGVDEALDKNKSGVSGVKVAIRPGETA